MSPVPVSHAMPMLSMRTHTGATAAVICNHHGLGGAGATDLAEAVVSACSSNDRAAFKFLYDVQLPIKVGATACMHAWACVGGHVGLTRTGSDAGLWP